tara:strand:- start:1185 stop:1511 length:327 start_codon:yes stop_codon:yes gene_type:complete
MFDVFDWIIQPILTVWGLAMVPFSITSAYAAYSKGRSEGIAFVLGLIFGPFGLLLVLVASRNGEVIDERSIRKGFKKRCRSCAETVKIAALKCRFCGEDFSVNYESVK